MSRLTLRLPETLHQQLADQAMKEGTSLNQYLVYSLTRLVTATDLQNQIATFSELTSRYSQEESETALQDLLAKRTPAAG